MTRVRKLNLKRKFEEVIGTGARPIRLRLRAQTAAEILVGNF